MRRPETSSGFPDRAVTADRYARYRNAVTDLIGSFPQPWSLDLRQGLKEVHEQGKTAAGQQRRKNSLNRVDPEIQFQFGTSSPIPEQDAAPRLPPSGREHPFSWFHYGHSERFRRSSRSTGRDRCWCLRPASMSSWSGRKTPSSCPSTTRLSP